MKLLYRKYDKTMTEIAQLDDSLTHKQAIDLAIEKIQEFCKQDGRIVYRYCRVWNEMCDGVLMTKFDVGSYSEFFYLDRETDIASLRSNSEK